MGSHADCRWRGVDFIIILKQMKSSTLMFLITCPVMLLSPACSKDDNNPGTPDNIPPVDSASFSHPLDISNPYYGPGPNQVYVYAGGAVGMTPEEEIRIERKTSTRTVMGVDCIVHHDVVYLNGVVIEDTDDWLAQDDTGNLWYFGEFSSSYDDNGNFIGTDGSWEAGVDGALPGYWMPGNPFVGQRYHQEYQKGVAEDQAEVLALNVTVTIALGTYTGCLVTKDFTRFEPDEYEKKYYAPGIGLIKEEKFDEGTLEEIVELVESLE